MVGTSSGVPECGTRRAGPPYPAGASSRDTCTAGPSRESTSGTSRRLAGKHFSGRLAPITRAIWNHRYPVSNRLIVIGEVVVAEPYLANPILISVQAEIAESMELLRAIGYGDQSVLVRHDGSPSITGSAAFTWRNVSAGRFSERMKLITG